MTNGPQLGGPGLCRLAYQGTKLDRRPGADRWLNRPKGIDNDRRSAERQLSSQMERLGRLNDATGDAVFDQSELDARIRSV